MKIICSILTPAQVAHYAVLRGYAGSAAKPAAHPPAGSHHGHRH